MASVTFAVIVRFQFEGIHSWPDAPQDQKEAYLVHPHRHLFYVEAEKTVQHMERDVEFIALRRRMLEYCEQFFGAEHAMSCEHMALILVKHFALRACRVFEDNENGAEVRRVE